MKTMTVSHLYRTLFFFAFCILGACTPDYSSDQDDQYTTVENEINQVLEGFAESQEAKDGEAHRSLFVSASSGIHFVIKNPENPFISSLLRDQWIGFFESWDYEYFATYSNKEYHIGQGMVVQAADFQGVRDGVDDISGKDVFAYVNTPEGWKILGVSSSITFPGDLTDYTTATPIATTPNEAVDAIVQGLNSQDQEQFLSAFINPKAPCFQFKTVFDTPYSEELHAADAFYQNTFGTTTGLALRLVGTKVMEKDQFTAVVSAGYRIQRHGKRYEKGQVLMTLLATPETGWKITNMMLSQW